MSFQIDPTVVYSINISVCFVWLQWQREKKKVYQQKSKNTFVCGNFVRTKYFVHGYSILFFGCFCYSWCDRLLNKFTECNLQISFDYMQIMIWQRLQIVVVIVSCRFVIISCVILAFSLEFFRTENCIYLYFVCLFISSCSAE